MSISRATILDALTLVYLLAGDEVVVSKSGKQTYGVDRFFSSLASKPINGLSFFVLSLVSVEGRQSFPIGIEQVIKSDAEIHSTLPIKKVKLTSLGRIHLLSTGVEPS